jgi:hypothetical protein
LCWKEKRAAGLTIRRGSSFADAPRPFASLVPAALVDAVGPAESVEALGGVGDLALEQRPELAAVGRCVLEAGKRLLAGGDDGVDLRLVPIGVGRTWRISTFSRMAGIAACWKKRCFLTMNSCSWPGVECGRPTIRSNAASARRPVRSQSALERAMYYCLEIASPSSWPPHPAPSRTASTTRATAFQIVVLMSRPGFCSWSATLMGRQGDW